MFQFKEKNWFQQENIPTDVKTAINEYKDFNVGFIKSSYAKIIPITEENTRVFYQVSTNEKPIKDAIIQFTARTDEVDLTTLPVSNTDVLLLIKRLIFLQFLPTNEEFDRLYAVFNNEKDKRHRKPFKFNGLALALSLITIVRKPTPQPTGIVATAATAATAAPAAPAAPAAMDTTNIPQKYIFVFDPRQSMSWVGLNSVILPNSICHKRLRIRMCSSTNEGDVPHPFGGLEGDREIATYNKFHIVDGVQLKPEVNHKIQTGDALIRDPNQAHHDHYTKTAISDNRQPRGGGEYKFYRIEKRTQYIDFTNLRYPKCRNQIYIPVSIETVYEYDEDGIINWVYISFQHKGVVDKTNMPAEYYCRPDHTTPSKAVYDEVIGSMEQTLKLGLNPKVTDIHKIGELEPLKELTIDIQRDVTLSPVAATGSLNRYTLVMNGPGRWDIRTATQTQTAAFNKVNQYLTKNKIKSYDMLQIKRFRVSNNGEGADEIMVIIEVKEMNVDGTLKRAICMGETLSHFEVLDTYESAVARKNNKEANFNWVTSSGPG
jgi:hypothetical protein